MAEPAPWRAYERAGADAGPALWLLAGKAGARGLLERFFRLRWLAASPFQRRVCGRRATVGELLLAPAVAGYAALCLVRWGDVKGTGGPPQYFLALTFATACRNSVWTLLLGIPFERALRYHKLFALLAVALGAYHGFVGYWCADAANRKDHHGADLAPNGVGDDGSEEAPTCVVHKVPPGDGEWLTGFLFEGAMLLLVLLSAPPLRRRLYELFHAAHWVFFLTAVVTGALHGAGSLFIGAGLYAADVIARLAFVVLTADHSAAARLIPLPGDVVRIAFPKRASFQYKGGQYFFACVPALGLWDWHPFSVSSAPHEEEVSLHVRALGGWTRRLRDLAARGGGEGAEARVLLDGPYGASSVDLDSAKYRCVLCISGGIGITPLQSVTNDLLAQHAAGRPLRHIYFVWSVRDRGMLAAMHAGPPSASGRLPLSFQPDLLPTHRLSLGPHLGAGASEPTGPAGGTEPTEPAEAEAVAVANRGTAGGTDEPLLGGVEADPADDVLHSEFYLTQGDEGGGGLDAAGIAPGVQRCVSSGRPDLAAVFRRMRGVARAAGEDRVAALVCGPSAMVDDVRRLCRDDSGGVTFDCHAEVFEF